MNWVFLICVSFFIISSPSPSLSQATSHDSLALLVSPRSIIAGESFRILISSSAPLDYDTLEVTDQQGIIKPINNLIKAGGPHFWRTAEFRAGKEGPCQISLKRNLLLLSSQTIQVMRGKNPSDPSECIWKAERAWNRNMENLYSAWIERLFFDQEEGVIWNPLHEVTRNPNQNFLYNHLGLNEDSSNGIKNLKMNPDCADNPFFLRAYFSWKLGLPFGIQSTTEGKRVWINNHSFRKKGQNELAAFQSFLHMIMNQVHSRSLKAPFSQDATDLYPVPLTRASLTPGTVFADPHGHILTIIRWVPQSENQSGMMLAVDAQPDGTIGIKRFWRGNFLFASNASGSPGFKAFRPIILEKNGQLTLLKNQILSNHKDYGNFSLQQKAMPSDDFYDTMERIINPLPLDPAKAFYELHKAVHELLLVRVIAVANGEKHMVSTKYAVMSMPSGPRIFQTTGPWEDYSTPSRDMRLLISMDVLLDFPDRVVRNPDAFTLSDNQDITRLKQTLLELHSQWAQEMTITYSRSDGSEQILTLAQIIARKEALEMAYNPNDCIEIRWGASPSSEEYSNCSRQAPAEQHQKMKAYRHWFQKRMFPQR